MIDGDDRELFEHGVRHALTRGDPTAVDAALEELGWPDALVADPATAVSVLFTLQGEANATSGALGRVVADVVAPEITDATVVLPPLGSSQPPGRIQDRRLSVTGVVVGSGPRARRALVVACDDLGDDVAVVVPTAELVLEPVDGLDPRLGLVEVRGTDLAVEVEAAPAPAWTDAVARARLAVGHELVGAACAMLELARAHALERVQFGQPIARFQAVRHRLAETLVAVETARALLDAAWIGDAPTTPAMAKAMAGRSARTAARHCQQVLAGIGFTTEHDLHRFVRRVLVLDELLGSARALTRALGEQVLADRALPPLLAL